ncbi:MAG: hypothetical protein Q8M76_19325, partial [Spirochaetaceae bacterium]|nr:hypothetical protein [Spirochaetaceae bacterium]
MELEDSVQRPGAWNRLRGEKDPRSGRKGSRAGSHVASKRGDFLDRHSTTIAGAALAAILLPSAIADVASGNFPGLAVRIFLVSAALSVSLFPGIPRQTRRAILSAVLFVAGALFMIRQGPA